MSLAKFFPELRAARYDPFADEFFHQALPRSPAMDLKETKDSYIIKADVPGFTKEQIEIDAQGSTLSVKGNYVKADEKKDEHHHVKERVESSFSRSVQLPISISAEKIKASLKDGILEVVVPKDAPKPSKIAIQ